MCSFRFSWLLALSLLLASWVMADQGSAAPDDGGEEAVASGPSIEEARLRARLLHEVLHGALQVMHRDFFDPEERDVIPSASLEDVFEVMEEQHEVELRWLVVNARAMDTDHKPRDKFEEAAVEALVAGKGEYLAVEEDRFRYAGAIQLHNECLKCHVPNRTTLEDRTAGLLISFPLNSTTNSKAP